MIDIDATRGWYGTIHPAVAAGASVKEHGDEGGALVVASTIPFKVRVWSASRPENPLTVIAGQAGTVRLALPPERWEAEITNMEWQHAADVYTAFVP